MNWVGLERGVVVVSVIFLARVVGRIRGSKKQTVALTTPLVDTAILEAVFHPRPKDGDDANLLAEMQDTFAHLNRRAYAEEFWSLHEQLTALDTTLGPPQKATLRRALVRLVTANDRWLQIVGAKTAADLGVSEVIPPLRALLELGGSADVRGRQVLEEALDTLTGQTSEARG